MLIIVSEYSINDISIKCCKAVVAKQLAKVLLF